MKKFILLGMAVLFGSFLLSASAHALPTLWPYQENTFKFRDFTNLEDDNGNGHASAGEEIWSIIKITSIQDTWANEIWSPSGDELTGSMEGVLFPSDYLWPQFDVVYDVTNAYVTLYYDSTPDWDPTQEPGVRPGTANSAYSRATDGDDLDGDGTADDIWLQLSVYHYEAHFDATQHPNLYEGQATGFLDVVVDNTGYGWMGDMYWFDEDGDGIQDPGEMHDFFMECDLTPLQIAGPGWEYDSDNPTRGYPTPEPATLLLLGSGLIGLAGFARKKLKK